MRPARVNARDYVKGLGWRWGKCRELVVGYAIGLVVALGDLAVGWEEFAFAGGGVGWAEDPPA